MKDILRFKAYSRSDKKVHDVDRINRNAADTGWLVYTEDGKLLGIDGKDCDLMQFVGKRDKTGRDIHAGHILRYILPPEHGPDDRPDIYIVERAEQCFVARWANPPTPRAIELTTSVLSLEGTEKDMEIIGTTFENPEILKAVA